MTTTINPLRAARQERGISQYVLAGESGVDRATISLIEQGKRRVQLSHLRAIAKALDVPVRDLLEPEQVMTLVRADDAPELLGIKGVAAWIKQDASRIEQLNVEMAT